MLVRDCIEVIALNVYHRVGDRPVDIDAVNRRITELLQHRRSCDCGPCEAAERARENQEQILRTVAAWQREAGVVGHQALGGRADQQQIQALHAAGLSVQQICEQLGCSRSTAERYGRRAQVNAGPSFIRR